LSTADKKDEQASISASGPVLPAFLPQSFRAMSPNLAASILMILAFVVFTLMSVLVRHVGDRVPIVQVVLVRQLVTFALLAPWVWRERAQIRRPTGLKLHLARGVLAVGSMTCGLSAVLLIPLADVTAIQMAEVLFVTALAALVLGEKVGWRRWSATAVGFLGVAIMVRPFGQGVETAALLALVGALFGAGGMVALRLGSAHDGTGTVLFWQGVVVLALITPVALWFWVTPSLPDALMLIFMGVVFTVGQWLWTYALRMGEASALAPLNYIKLLMAGVVGWLAYGETPTLETVAGGLLVMGAATYTIHRNARQAARVRPATLTPS